MCWFRLCFVLADQIEERQEKMQREVVDARHGVNFVMVRSVLLHTNFDFELQESGKGFTVTVHFNPRQNAESLLFSHAE